MPAPDPRRGPALFNRVLQKRHGVDMAGGVQWVTITEALGEVTMIIAAHQPNYLPWLGFFDRVRRADKFLLLDHVQFERQNYQNRTRVRMGDGWKWLTVPVVQKSRDELISEKLIANDREGRLRWGRKAWVTLEQVYRGAPYFHLYSGELRRIYEQRWDRLVDLNLALLDFCLEALDIRTPVERTSRMGLTGRKSELVLNMCRAAGATVYLSGEGASRDYLDLAAFKANGIEVRWQSFRHPDYAQYPPTQRPLHGLSVVDLLFNCGPSSTAVLAGSRNVMAPPPQARPTSVPTHDPALGSL